MKRIAITYLYLLLSSTLALDCQCNKTSSKNGIRLTIQPSSPHVGDDVCLCCLCKSSDSGVNFYRNNEAILCSRNTSICWRKGYILKLKNVTRERAGNWTCGNKYSNSNVVYIHIDERGVRGDFDVVYHQPTDIYNLSEIIETINYSSTLSTTPETETTVTVESTTLKLEVLSSMPNWLLWVVIAVMVFLFLLAAFICYCWYKNSSEAYTPVNPQVIQMAEIEKNVMTMVTALNIHSALARWQSLSFIPTQHRTRVRVDWVRSLSAEDGLCRRQRQGVHVFVEDDEGNDLDDINELVGDDNYYESYDNLPQQIDRQSNTL